jgi:hypothetical protein
MVPEDRFGGCGCTTTAATNALRPWRRLPTREVMRFPATLRSRALRVRCPIVASAAAALVVAVPGCGGDGRSGSTASPSSGAAATPLGEEVSLEAEVLDLAGVDWEEATYLSVCGLGPVRVRGGVGEASSSGSTYGVEVVDVDLADLDGDGADDAAVLVDCLGGDSYAPHVVVVPAGGSLPAGDRPVDIDARSGGRIDVELRDGGEPTAQTMQYAPDVLLGGELPASPGEVVAGVLTSVEGGEAVLAVAPDAGYRLGVVPGTAVHDPDLGATVPIESARGRTVTVTVGDGPSAADVTLAPAGP